MGSERWSARLTGFLPLPSYNNQTTHRGGVLHSREGEMSVVLKVGGHVPAKCSMMNQPEFLYSSEWDYGTLGRMFPSKRPMARGDMADGHWSTAGGRWLGCVATHSLKDFS